jgi:hypothetical protein
MVLASVHQCGSYPPSLENMGLEFYIITRPDDSFLLPSRICPSFTDLFEPAAQKSRPLRWQDGNKY